MLNKNVVTELAELARTLQSVYMNINTEFQRQLNVDSLYGLDINRHMNTLVVGISRIENIVNIEMNKPTETPTKETIVEKNPIGKEMVRRIFSSIKSFGKYGVNVYEKLTTTEGYFQSWVDIYENDVNRRNICIQETKDCKEFKIQFIMKNQSSMMHDVMVETFSSEDISDAYVVIAQFLFNNQYPKQTLEGLAYAKTGSAKVQHFGVLSRVTDEPQPVRTQHIREIGETETSWCAPVTDITKPTETTTKEVEMIKNPIGQLIVEGMWTHRIKTETPHIGKLTTKVIGTDISDCAHTVVEYLNEDDYLKSITVQETKGFSEFKIKFVRPAEMEYFEILVVEFKLENIKDAISTIVGFLFYNTHPQQTLNANARMEASAPEEYTELEKAAINKVTKEREEAYAKFKEMNVADTAPVEKEEVILNPIGKMIAVILSNTVQDNPWLVDKAPYLRHKLNFTTTKGHSKLFTGARTDIINTNGNSVIIHESPDGLNFRVKFCIEPTVVEVSTFDGSKDGDVLRIISEFLFGSVHPATTTAAILKETNKAIDEEEQKKPANWGEEQMEDFSSIGSKVTDIQAAMGPVVTIDKPEEPPKEKVKETDPYNTGFIIDGIIDSMKNLTNDKLEIRITASSRDVFCDFNDKPIGNVNEWHCTALDKGQRLFMRFSVQQKADLVGKIESFRIDFPGNDKHYVYDIAYGDHAALGTADIANVYYKAL